MSNIPTIPIIDVSSFASSNNDHETSARKHQTAKEVYNACVDTGFFLIKGYDSILPQEKINHLFECMRDFFSLSLEEKKKCPHSNNKGYFAVGEENLTTVHPHLNEEFIDKDLGDYKEGFDIGREIDPTDPEYNLPFRHPNQWPSYSSSPPISPHHHSLSPIWKDDMLDYFSHADKLAHVLMRIFATALQMNEYWFEDKTDKPMTLLRLLHYPPRPVDQPRFGCGAHSDYGCCTILAQDDAGGLQLLTTSNEWIDIPSVPNTLVVNIGDMMQRWTNNKFKSTIHRVINPSTQKHRFSAPFFFDPSFDAIVDCIESCKVNGKALFEPIKFGDHLKNMYESTYKQAAK